MCRLEVVTLLVDAGASIDIQDKVGLMRVIDDTMIILCYTWMLNEVIVRFKDIIRLYRIEDIILRLYYIRIRYWNYITLE